MLPEEALIDLANSAGRSIREGSSYYAINTTGVHNISPELPFGGDEAKQAAAYVRDNGGPACALEAAAPGRVTEHILMVGRTNKELLDTLKRFQKCFKKSNPGGQLQVLDSEAMIKGFIRRVTH